MYLPTAFSDPLLKSLHVVFHPQSVVETSSITGWMQVILQVFLNLPGPTPTSGIRCCSDTSMASRLFNRMYGCQCRRLNGFESACLGGVRANSPTTLRSPVFMTDRDRARLEFPLSSHICRFLFIDSTTGSLVCLRHLSNHL